MKNRDKAPVKPARVEPESDPAKAPAVPRPAGIPYDSEPPVETEQEDPAPDSES